MAASDLAKIVSLTLKANDLHKKSHYERSLEKWRSALAAAEALGAEDCVLVARFRSEVVCAVLNCECARHVPFSQAFVLEQLDLLAVSAASLRRRRDAGTLMEGKCRPIETQWSIGVGPTGCGQARYGRGAARDAKLRASAASLVGYEAFLHLFCSCMDVLGAAIYAGSFERGAETTEQAFLSLVCDVCDDAVALMVKPRVLKECIAIEIVTLTKWRPTLKALARAPEHRFWHDRVAAAFVRLCRSRVLKNRGLASVDIADLIASSHESSDRAEREREAAAASGQLQSCAMAGCGATEAHISHFGKCGACKAAVYCCRDHQQMDWPAHKAACKAARKAAAAAKEAA